MALNPNARKISVVAGGTVGRLGLLGSMSEIPAWRVRWTAKLL
jgi:hypothetical protein